MSSANYLLPARPGPCDGFGGENKGDADYPEPVGGRIVTTIPFYRAGTGASTRDGVHFPALAYRRRLTGP